MSWGGFGFLRQICFEYGPCKLPCRFWFLLYGRCVMMLFRRLDQEGYEAKGGIGVKPEYRMKRIILRPVDPCSFITYAIQAPFWSTLSSFSTEQFPIRWGGEKPEKQHNSTAVNYYPLQPFICDLHP